MKNKRKRILCCTESSTTLSGFGVISKELISRIHDTGKYDIAELANYGFVNDPRDKDINWTWYANAVHENDPRAQFYNSNPVHQFGAWRFERVCLDWKPDVTFAYNDPWQMIFQNQSPFRRLFHLAWCPTVDSVPQQEIWVDHFCRVDSVLTYTDWAQKALHKQAGNNINLCGVATPGVDMDFHKPVINKLEHRRKLGLHHLVPEDANIVGMISRNQRRKLFPNLMDAFNLFRHKCYKEGKKELADKTYLYFHTSYPDMIGCWNLPRLLKEKGLGHKILFTYVCRACQHSFPIFFQDTKTVCPRCSNVAALTPTVSHGCSKEEMVNIINTFDLYVQYASNEGLGMALPEAASCGVPVMATDYSAMTDVVRQLNGYPIKVINYNRSVEEDAEKAAPDNQHCAELMYKFFTMSPSEQRAKGQKAREGVAKYFTWDNLAKVWMNHFDSIELTGEQGQWDAPPKYLHQLATNEQCPPNLSNEDFVEWAIVNVLGDKNELGSVMHLDMVRALNYEAIVQTGQPTKPYGRNEVLGRLNEVRNAHNNWEQARCGAIPLPMEDYLEYAKIKGA